MAGDGPRPRITVVGLGPAGATYTTEPVTALVAGSPAAFLRTRRHPAAAGLEAVASFDHLYEEAETFDAVYAAIVEALAAEASARAPEPVVYAVPGSPLIAERTVELLRADDRVDVTIVPALSFLDLAWERLGVDPLADGVRLLDAEQFAASPDPGPCLVAQCWSGPLLSDIKLSAPEADDLPDVVLLHHLGLDDEQVVTVGWWDMDRTIQPDHLTSLYIPGRVMAPDAMARLEALVATLRQECPWDRAQTHATLRPHLLEESYEVLDALDGLGDAASFAHLEEELGDLLFQIVFHARLAEEEERFTLDDVARGVHDKLVHRHPHVFGDVEAETPEQVASNWEEIKKREKGRSSVTEGIPNALPALLLATKLQRKGIAVDAGRGPVDAEGMLAQLLALTAEAAEAGADSPLSADAADEMVGSLLFEVADLSRRLGIDPEQALRARALLHRDRIVGLEGDAGS